MATKAETVRRVALRERLIRRYSIGLRRAIYNFFLSHFDGAEIAKARIVRTGSKALTRRVLSEVSEAYRSNIIDRDSGLAITITNEEKNSAIARLMDLRTPALERQMNGSVQNIFDSIDRTLGTKDVDAKTKRDFKRLFLRFSETKARSIARDVLSQTYSEGKQAFWDTKFPEQEYFKEWLPSIGGNNDRYWHNAIPRNGPVEKSGTFKIDGPNGIFHCLYPHDTVNLPPSEWKNCACDYRIFFRESERLSLRRLMGGRSERQIEQVIGV